MHKTIKTIALAVALFALGAGLRVYAATPTLYDCYQQLGWKWETVEQRAVTAAEYGIWGYKGSVEQNTKLASLLCPEKSDTLGFSVVTGYRSTISLPMTSSQTTVPVASVVTKDGHTITMSDLGDYVFLTLEPGASKEEIVKCTGISSSSFTGCTRGLAFYGATTTAVTANQKTHNAGSIIVMSNVHYVYDEKIDKNDASFTFGTGANTDMYINFDTGTTTNPGFKYTSSTNQLGFRRYGESAYREIPLSLRGTYANYASLPATASEGDIAITSDDNKLYTYDLSGTTWVLAGGSSGAGTVYKTEKLGSESDSGDLKTFTLTAGSWPSTNFLLVYKNGQFQRIGASYDFVEVDSNTIQFNYTLASDDLVSMVVVSVDLYNPAWGVVNGSIIPDTNNAYDIGSSSLYFKDVYTTGTLRTKYLNVNGVNATSTPTANAIPIAGTGGSLFGWGSKFGGTGADGALTLSDATSSIDLGGAKMVVKNYTSISITGASSLSFTNPHPNGTIIILKSQNNTTITCSSAPCIDLRGLGALGGTTSGGAGTIGTGVWTVNSAHFGQSHTGTTGGAGGIVIPSSTPYLVDTYGKESGKFLAAGSGGSAGAGTGFGAGGRGGGALLIEVGGYLNFTVANGINCSGGAGSSATASAVAGGGGGGSAGMCAILYNNLTSASGTILASGGAGGSSTGDIGGGNCSGGGGAGSIYAVGGAGGNDGGGGNVGGGLGAGAGGGACKNPSGTTGGTGGGSMGGFMSTNTLWF